MIWYCMLYNFISKWLLVGLDEEQYAHIEHMSFYATVVTNSWFYVDLSQVMYMGSTQIFLDCLNMVDFLQKPITSSLVTMLIVANSR